MRGSSRALLRFAAAMLSVVGAVSGGARAQDPQALLKKYDCSLCHAENDAGTGPPWVDVAAKYRGDPRAVATLVALMQKGTHGSGLWSMPPLPQVPDVDARLIARYILTIGK
jgi:cytochrome c